MSKKTVRWKAYKHDADTVLVEAGILSGGFYCGGVVHHFKRKDSEAAFRQLIEKMSADVAMIIA